LRTSTSLIAIDASAPPVEAAATDYSANHSSANLFEPVIRAILELIGKGSCQSVSESEENSVEEVLVDTEVDGSRYLLVRMPKPARNRVQLSPREQEIVRMVAKGHPNKIIADVLNISSWTVCTHMRRIFAKLGVGSRAAMVAQLSELGVLSKEHRLASAEPVSPRKRSNL
jgi:two-component system nitrate/nitrite response regulator NarL